MKRFHRSMLKKKRLEIPHNMGVGTMAWGDAKAGFVSDPKHRPKAGEFNPADIQVREFEATWAEVDLVGSATPVPDCPTRRDGVFEVLYDEEEIIDSVPD